MVAAKRECEDLKEGVWLEPIQAVLKKNTNQACTDKHRHVMRKLVLDGGWVQKRLYDSGLSDDKTCRGCNRGEDTGKHRMSQINWASRNKGSRHQKGIASHTLSESNWRSSHLSVRKGGVGAC